MPQPNRDLPYDELVRRTAMGPFREANLFLKADDHVNYLISFHETHGIVRLLAEAMGIQNEAVMKDIRLAYDNALGNDGEMDMENK